MKPRLFLLLSGALNAALLAAVVALASLPRVGTEPAPPVRVVLKRLVRTAPAGPPAPATPTAAVPMTNALVAAPAFHWSQVAAEDLRRYMENLRAIGCPEETVRDIIRAAVQSLFRERLSALVRPLQPRFWAILAKGEKHNDVLEQSVKQVETLDNERKEMLTALLGTPDGKVEQKTINRYEQVLGDVVSEEKLAKSHALTEKYLQMDRDLRSHLANVPKEEVEKQVAALRREEKQAQEALLTPEELAEYRLRTSPIANARETFSGLLNEEEFRKLAALGVKIGDKADAASNDQVKNVIGPERFAEFQRVQDNAFLQLETLARRAELPRETAVQVYEMKRAADAQLQRAKADKSLTEETRDELVRAIHAESERATAAALGERAMKIYRKIGGEWIGK